MSLPRLWRWAAATLILATSLLLVTASPASGASAPRDVAASTTSSEPLTLPSSAPMPSQQPEDLLSPFLTSNGSGYFVPTVNITFWNNGNPFISSDGQTKYDQLPNDLLPAMRGETLPGNRWDLWLLWLWRYSDKIEPQGFEHLRSAIAYVAPSEDKNLLHAFNNISTEGSTNKWLLDDTLCGSCGYTMQKTYCSDSCLPPATANLTGGPIDNEYCALLNSDRKARLATGKTLVTQCFNWPITATCNDCIARKAKKSVFVKNCLRCHEFWSAPLTPGYLFNPYTLNLSDIGNQFIYFDNTAGSGCSYRSKRDPGSRMEDAFKKCKVTSVSYSGTIHGNLGDCTVHAPDPTVVGAGHCDKMPGSEEPIDFASGQNVIPAPEMCAQFVPGDPGLCEGDLPPLDEPEKLSTPPTPPGPTNGGATPANPAAPGTNPNGVPNIPIEIVTNGGQQPPVPGDQSIPGSPVGQPTDGSPGQPSVSAAGFPTSNPVTAGNPSNATTATVPAAAYQCFPIAPPVNNGSAPLDPWTNTTSPIFTVTDPHGVSQACYTVPASIQGAASAAVTPPASPVAPVCPPQITDFRKRNGVLSSPRCTAAIPVAILFSTWLLASL
ncbi:uncharacterized protein EV422DRAFT_113029 [Fimicolochytrium jonesii]|uniref:uncharacterized protein n=1 Tax=Fimicolochytrium jonesii TaxID=1396493 RepID=UPI0022FEA0EC|nr:uncharacterized protein EV422DRAFT_113029 [Fimicolochytrium jonesii]KAI8819443.1 hypothetical protein EV422DRAFT_113029 [Fimicolochytrium jonesii]